MKSLQTFAALFGNKLYNTGFYDVVRDSGLMTCTDVADARESIAYILGSTKAAKIANGLLATIDGAPYPREVYERAGNIAHEVYEGFAALRDALVKGASEAGIADACEAFEVALLAVSVD